MDRRTFLQGTLAGAATLAIPHHAAAADPDLSPVWTQIEKHHDEAVQRLEEWIKQPSIAAGNRGVNEGCDLSMRFLREAGFTEVAKIPTDGQPGIFAKLDAGAPKTLELYFMYDVKHVGPLGRMSIADTPPPSSPLPRHETEKACVEACESVLNRREIRNIAVYFVLYLCQPVSSTLFHAWSVISSQLIVAPV